MKASASSVIVSAVFLLTVTSAQAAFNIATDGSIGSGNYAYTGPGGTAASASTASAGQLPATTDPTPTFFTLGHVFGGNGTTDEYTFSYTPSVDGDNTSFAADTAFNSLQGLFSTGLDSGGAGFYNVYRIHPGNPGVSGGLTTYRVFVNGVEVVGLSQTIDQNASNLATGENIGRWELVGNVEIPNATDTVSVTMTPETSSFVSMRASGIMFEYVAVPEPTSFALLAGMFGLVWVVLRRR